MHHEELQAEYLNACFDLSCAKKRVAKARTILLAYNGIVTDSLTRAECKGFEQQKIDAELLKITVYAKESKRWDSKKLEELGKEDARILRARTMSYRSEARITEKD